MEQVTIYKITHVASGKCYVGSTKSDPPVKRWWHHRSDLNRGVHPAKMMQNSWNKYGQAAFVFEIIERCLEKDRVAREQFHIDALVPFFNWAMTVSSPVLDPKVARQISEAMRGNQNTKGLKWSEEARARLSLARKGHPQSDAQRAATLASLKRAREKTRANKPGWIPTHRIGMKDSDEVRQKRRESVLASFAAERASGVRRVWITDGVVECKINSSDAPPTGWRHGRRPRHDLSSPPAGTDLRSDLL